MTFIQEEESNCFGFKGHDYFSWRDMIKNWLHRICSAVWLVLHHPKFEFLGFQFQPHFKTNMILLLRNFPAKTILFHLYVNEHSYQFLSRLKLLSGFVLTLSPTQNYRMIFIFIWWFVKGIRLPGFTKSWLIAILYRLYNCLRSFLRTIRRVLNSGQSNQQIQWNHSSNKSVYWMCSFPNLNI